MAGCNCVKTQQPQNGAAAGACGCAPCAGLPTSSMVTGDEVSQRNALILADQERKARVLVALLKFWTEKGCSTCR